MKIYFSDRFREHETGSHPERPKRMDAVSSALREAFGEELKWAEPRLALEDDLLLVHTPEHIRRMRALAEQGGGMADPDTVVSPASYEIAKLACGAQLAAVDSILADETRRTFVAARPPGHHATPDRAMGFCLFSNVAIAARYAQKSERVDKVLIVDWDVHHGNGSQDVFYEDDTVFFLSTHQYPFYPGTGAAHETGRGKGDGFTRNLPFPAETNPKRIVESLSEALEEIVPAFKPNLIIISAGFDGHRDDPLGGWLMEEAHFAQLTRTIVEQADANHAIGIVSCLEGGYDLRALGRSCAAHVLQLAEE